LTSKYMSRVGSSGVWLSATMATAMRLVNIAGIYTGGQPLHGEGSSHLQVVRLRGAGAGHVQSYGHMRGLRPRGAGRQMQRVSRQGALLRRN